MYFNIISSYCIRCKQPTNYKNPCKFTNQYNCRFNNCIFAVRSFPCATNLQLWLIFPLNGMMFASLQYTFSIGLTQACLDDILTWSYTLSQLLNASYIGSPGPFDHRTQKWSSYKTLFEHFLWVNEIREELKKTSCIIGAEMYETLESLTIPDKPERFKSQDLFKMLTSHFEPKRLKIAEQYSF